MELFGYELARARPVSLDLETKALQLRPVSSTGSWWPVIHESFTGAWQKNVTVQLEDVLAHPTVFACYTLIANDIAKMGLWLVEGDANAIWSRIESPAFSPVLRKPNRYQNRIQFIKQWLISKLTRGNTYVLKERDRRDVVVALYILDPSRVVPLVTPDGAVYYELKRDDLSGLGAEQVVVPAREIIHDRMYPIYHPLVGMGPLIASGVAAMLGLKIQTNSTQFFTNGSNPGGVLTAPGAISNETAARLKAYWDSAYTGENVGKVAVLGDGLKYEPMSVTPVDAQLTEQWRSASEAICSTFHVPKFMAGVGDFPPYANIEAVNVQYYSQCLQDLIEELELCLDEGLGLGPQFGNPYGVEFDIDDLLRMDSATAMTTITAGVTGGVLAPNEGRRKLNQKPVGGGDTPYLQQQMYSLEALNRRDVAAPPPLTPLLEAIDDDNVLPMAAMYAAIRRKSIAEGLYAA